MTRRSKESIKLELSKVRDRLAMYEKREETMLSSEGVQLYTIGSRSLQRYQTTLSDIQKMIEQLHKRERELEAELAGLSARRAIGIVPHDW